MMELSSGADWSHTRSAPRTHTDMEQLGFYVCINNLEEELIRAVGTAGVDALCDSQGDLRSFRSFQSQPAWRGPIPTHPGEV